jgi:tRNA(Ile)-lysidine synthase
MAGIETRNRDGVIRPLLPWNRRDVTAWLKDRDIAWREDGSNNDVGRLRNRVRHQVLPHLAGDVPELANHLVNLAGALAEAEAFMADELRARAAFADPWDPRGGVDLRTLENLPRALRTRWLQSQALRLGAGAATRRQLELFNDLLDKATPRSVTLGGRWRLRRARGRLWAEPPRTPEGVDTDLADGDRITLGLPGWTVRNAIGEPPHPRAVWYWRPCFASSVIHIRSATKDDRLTAPSGALRRARDLLAETLPRHLRPAWPLFCEDDMIHWIPGVWRHSMPGDPSNRVVEVIRP